MPLVKSDWPSLETRGPSAIAPIQRNDRERSMAYFENASGLMSRHRRKMPSNAMGDARQERDCLIVAE